MNRALDFIMIYKLLIGLVCSDYYWSMENHTPISFVAFHLFSGVVCVLLQRVYLLIQSEFPHSPSRCSGAAACIPLTLVLMGMSSLSTFS